MSWADGAVPESNTTIFDSVPENNTTAFEVADTHPEPAPTPTPTPAADDENWFSEKMFGDISNGGFILMFVGVVAFLAGFIFF